MFDRIYNFRSVGKRRGEPGITVHLFVFRTPKKRYIVFEGHLQDDCPLATVKFYDKAHRLSDNRFSLLSRSHEAASIIRTAVEIMLHLYRQNPLLSFAFMGAADLDGDTQETRRFRIYRGLLVRLFTEQAFLHIQKPQKSLYVMLNRAYCESDANGQANIFQALFDTYPEAKQD